MKRVNNILKIFFLMIAVLLITANISKAVDYGATMNLTGSKTTAHVGDTVTYTLALKSATNVEGVATVHAKINYDKAVLQYVSCEATNSWSAPVYNEANQEFVTERSDVMKPEGNIIKVTFKVISIPANKTTTVSITNFDVADTDNQITVGDVSANLKIEEKSSKDYLKKICSKIKLIKIPFNIIPAFLIPNITSKNNANIIDIKKLIKINT